MQNSEAPKLQKLTLLRSSSTLNLALKASTIAVAVLALYYADLNLIFADALQSEATNYVLAIPFIFGYFLYRKRKMLRTVAFSDPSDKPGYMRYASELLGMLLCATAIILYWYGSYTFTPLEYHALTLPIFTAGLVLVLFNVQTLREMVFPIIFLVFLTPPPSTILYGIGSTLSVVASEVSNASMALFGIPSRISGEYGNPMIIITRPDKTTMGFTLDIACSGIYPLMGFVIFAFLTAYITRDKTWKKASIFLLGIPLIYLLNIVRISGILVIGYYYGEQLALQIFHLLGGLVVMAVGIVILLAVSEKLFKTQIFTTAKPPQPCPSCNPTGKIEGYFCGSCGRLLRYPSVKLHGKEIAKILAVAAAVVILVSIQVPVFALTKGPAQVTIQTPRGEVGNTQILPLIQNYNVSFIYRDKSFEQTAKQDASLVYSYGPEDQASKSVWVAVEVAPTRSPLHPWETCLITWPQTHGYQPKVAQLDLRDIQIQDNPPIIARYFAFEYTNYNETQVVLYWYETSIFMTSKGSEQKQVKISLISYPRTPQDVAEAEDAMLPFAKAITGYWQPIKTWSPIALAMSQNGSNLTPAVLALLAGTMIFYAVEKKRYGKAKTRTYNKLSEEDQQIMDATRLTKKTSPATFLNIAATYQNMTGREIGHEVLSEKLTQAKESGLISSQIINQNDEPTAAWNTNFKWKQTKSRLRPPSFLKKTLRGFTR